MTRVLLTGASGFVGSNVLRYFLEHRPDWEFTCVCSWRHRGNPLNISVDRRVEVITHDLTGPIPDIGDFEYILNLASESHVDRSLQEPVNFVENNVSSVLQVLEYARKCPALKALIQFSTDEVYGAVDHEEWSVLLPSNPYAASKACQEAISISYWRAYGVPVVVTTSNNVCGPFQNEEKYVPKLVNLIGSGRDVQVHATAAGPGQRCYNPVENVADALLFILDRAPSRYVTGANRPDRYNLSGGECLDNLEMAQLIAELLGKKLEYTLVNAESVRPGYDEFYPKTEGRLTELGWKPVTTLRESLSRWLPL